MNVIVIEDEPRLAKLIAKTLRREFFEVTVRTDGAEGFDEALTDTYDVIVLDRMLPSMDGMTILEGLRRQRVETPVLMLTALGDVPDRIQGLRAGADDYLGKPFSFDELLARIPGTEPPVALRGHLRTATIRRNRDRPGSTLGYPGGSADRAFASRIRTARDSGTPQGAGAFTRPTPAQSVGF